MQDAPETDPTQAHRRRRLLDLLDLYGKNLSRLGRDLGYQDGVFVRQMRDGVRPISEKTVAKIEALPGRTGWFAPPPMEAIDADDTEFSVLQAMKEMADDDRQELLRMAMDRSAKYRKLTEEVMRKLTPTPTAGADDFKPKSKPGPYRKLHQPTAKKIVRKA